MIVFLRGLVVATGTSYVDLDVSGVGYRVFITEPHASTLSNGQETVVFTYHHVREDAVSLFGFESERLRDWFELLIGVSGIGPKGALQMLSGMEVDELAQAISEDDVDALCRLPGIGRKTAQRLIVELKEKISKLEWSVSALSGASRRITRNSGANPLERDTVEALVSLGYNEKQALEQVQNVLDGTDFRDVADVLRAALQRLAI